MLTLHKQRTLQFSLPSADNVETQNSAILLVPVRNCIGERFLSARNRRQRKSISRMETRLKITRRGSALCGPFAFSALAYKSSEIETTRICPPVREENPLRPRLHRGYRNSAMQPSSTFVKHFSLRSAPTPFAPPILRQPCSFVSPGDIVLSFLARFFACPSSRRPRTAIFMPRSSPASVSSRVIFRRADTNRCLAAGAPRDSKYPALLPRWLIQRCSGRVD